MHDRIEYNCNFFFKNSVAGTVTNYTYVQFAIVRPFTKCPKIDNMQIILLKEIFDYFKTNIW